MSGNFKTRLGKVRCMVFDIDGVLTDGSLIVMPGELYRVMNIRDGFALKEAVNAGYVVAIISGGKSESARTRLQNLGVTHIYLGVDKKTKTMEEIVTQHGLKPEEILYMGDDLPDFEVMKLCGVPCCPSDAAPEIKNLSVYVSPLAGGKGCVRDIIEQTMRLHGKWPYMNS